MGFALATMAILSQRLPVAFGVMIGCLVSLINFRLLAQSIPRVLGMSFHAARKSAAARYVFRYLLSVAMVLMVNANPNINVWAAFVGLLTVKIVILGEAVFLFIRQKLSGCQEPVRYERGEK